MIDKYNMKQGGEHPEPPVARWLVILLAILLLIQIRDDSSKDGYGDAWEGARGLRVFAQVHKEIKLRYRNPPSDKELFIAAIQGMLNRLNDPYSDYLPPSLQRQTSDLLDMQEIGGIGINLNWQDGGEAQIRAVLPDSPADKAGIRQGSTIIEIEDIPTSLMRMEQGLQRLRGAVGTKVSLKVKEPDGKTRLLTLTRAPLPRPKVADSGVIGEKDEIGLIRLYIFAFGASDVVEKQIEELKAQGVKGLILDLRGNGGGSLDEGLRLADMFLPKGKLITRIERRDPSPLAREPVRLTMNSEHEPVTDLPLVILINRFTASASELLSGALQDNRRAILVGEKSFGKARIQEIMPLGNAGGALKLTVGRYLTPKGKDIQSSGIEPDVKVDLDEMTRNILGQQWFYNWYGIPSNLPNIPDAQMEKAVETIGKEIGKQEKGCGIFSVNSPLSAIID